MYDYYSSSQLLLLNLLHFVTHLWHLFYSIYTALVHIPSMKLFFFSLSGWCHRATWSSKRQVRLFSATYLPSNHQYTLASQKCAGCWFMMANPWPLATPWDELYLISQPCNELRVTKISFSVHSNTCDQSGSRLWIPCLTEAAAQSSSASWCH